MVRLSQWDIQTIDERSTTSPHWSKTLLLLLTWCFMLVRAENLCHQAIFMDHASDAVSSPEAEVVQVSDAIWQRTERRGLVQGRCGRCVL
jgi:hypothetical protein